MLRFMTYSMAHSIRSTGTNAGILMSPDLPVFRVKVWPARLHILQVVRLLVTYSFVFLSVFSIRHPSTVGSVRYTLRKLHEDSNFSSLCPGDPRTVPAIWRAGVRNNEYGPLVHVSWIIEQVGAIEGKGRLLWQYWSKCIHARSASGLGGNN